MHMHQSNACMSCGSCLMHFETPSFRNAEEMAGRLAYNTRSHMVVISSRGGFSSEPKTSLWVTASQMIEIILQQAE